MAKLPHIIKQHVFDLTIDTMSEAFAIQQEVSEIANHALSRELEILFDELFPDDVIVRIDRVDIDLGRISRQEIQTALIEKLLVALKDSLPAPDSEPGTAVHPPEHDLRIEDPTARPFEAWLFFLRHGSLPWWFPYPGDPDYFEREVLSFLQSKPEHVDKVRSAIEQESTLERLILQYPDSFHGSILGLVLPQVDDLVRLVRRFVHQLNHFPARPTTRTLKEREFLTGWRALYLAFRTVDRVRTVEHQKLFISTTLKALLERHVAQASRRELLVNFQHELRLESGSWYTMTTRLVGDLIEEYATPEHRPSDQSASSLNDVQAEKNRTALSENEGPDGVATDRGKETNLEHSPASDHEDPDGERDQEDVRIHSREAPSPPESDYERSRSTHQNDQSPEPDSVDRQNVSENTELYVAHAGLVVLHPFLLTHFQSQGWVEHHSFASKESQQCAIHQLHYLATGQQGIQEYEMEIHKILCGFPLEWPVDRYVSLNEASLTEANTLLEAVIRHWEALKNSSPASLREGFLQRPGKLTRRNTHWLLQVEKNTIDILITKLPWGIGVVQLPWMRERLVVEWI